jgi:hypothetical protein
MPLLLYYDSQLNEIRHIWLTALSITILIRTVKYITQEAGMDAVMMSKCRSDKWRVAGSL